MDPKVNDNMSHLGMAALLIAARDFPYDLNDPRAFKLDHLQSKETYFSRMDFHFFNRPQAAFPFSWIQWKGTPQWTPKVSDTKGCMTLGHSNWTICSPRNLFLQNGFPLSCQATCSISLSLHVVKWAILNASQKWMTPVPRGEWPRGIQIGPFAVHKTYFCKMDFHFFRSHAAFPFSCIQRNGAPTVDPKIEWHEGVYDPGEFKLDHLQSTKPKFLKWISTLLIGHISDAVYWLFFDQRSRRSTKQRKFP